jgi:hypothetical protein
MDGFRQASDPYRSSFRPVLLLALACLAFLGLLPEAAAVTAQGTTQGGNLGSSRANLSDPNTKDFPTISAFLDAHDPGGGFLHQLTAAELSILEDDRPVTLQELNEIEPGMRFMVAINAGPALGIRDQQGNIRYDPLLKALQSWGSKLSAPGQKEGEWDYSLFTNQGALANTVSDPTEWLKAVNAYQPEMRSVQPSQESLSRALSLAALPTPRFGMERACQKKKIWPA